MPIGMKPRETTSISPPFGSTLWIFTSKWLECNQNVHHLWRLTTAYWHEPQWNDRTTSIQKSLDFESLYSFIYLIFNLHFIRSIILMSNGKCRHCDWYWDTFRTQNIFFLNIAIPALKQKVNTVVKRVHQNRFKLHVIKI